MKTPTELRSDAARCRRLAGGVADQQTVRSLLELAEDYEAQAQSLDPQPVAKAVRPDA